MVYIMQFVLSSKCRNCGIVFYDNQTGKEVKRIPFSETERRGCIYKKEIVVSDSWSYLFYEDAHLIPDWNAKSLMPVIYGSRRDIMDCRALCKECTFDWKGDLRPHIPYHNSIFYVMHVRGFSMHSSSGVKGKGTFSGIIEKIPYLKEIGITTLELQPAYEFLEYDAEFERNSEPQTAPHYLSHEIAAQKEEKLNYWGYKKGFYYAPKGSYAQKEASLEMKKLVRELHRNEMEIIMQFYFPDTVKKGKITEILNFWVEEYHIDGFHIMGTDLPISMIAEDDLLADTKLLYYNFELDKLYPQNETPYSIHLAEYEDSYMYDMRRFLKGDDNMMNTVLSHMRYIPSKAGRIHYFSNYNTFTLMDMVSYDYKHNEENGEENRDGNDYNQSWNCGEEGITKKRKIKQLRNKQIKNAMAMLLLTQSTPLIFMGDEFGNSQKGNNNPYCQDNPITWLDWSSVNKNKELFDFWKEMVSFRKKHAILHPEEQLLLTDTLACGYPDLSYHSENAWKQRTEGYTRHVGIMFCEKYAKDEESKQDGFLYIAMNMHWDSHMVALPKLPRNMQWKLYLTTTEKTGENETDSETVIKREDNVREITARSIQIYQSVIVESKPVKKGKGTGD